MAIAFVNATATASDASSGTIANASGLNVTTGNSLIVLTGCEDSRTVSSMADTAGNAFNRCGSVASITSTARLEIWAALNVTGNASNVVTATLSGNAMYRRIAVLQYSGMRLTAAHDTGFAPAFNSDSSSPYTSTAADTAENNELIVGVFWADAALTYTDSSPSVTRTQIGTDFCAADNAIASAGSGSVAVASSTSATVYIYTKAFKQAAAAASGKPWTLFYSMRQRLEEKLKRSILIPGFADIMRCGCIR